MSSKRSLPDASGVHNAEVPIYHLYSTPQQDLSWTRECASTKSYTNSSADSMFIDEAEGGKSDWQAPWLPGDMKGPSTLQYPHLSTCNTVHLHPTAGSVSAVPVYTGVVPAITIFDSVERATAAENEPTPVPVSVPIPGQNTSSGSCYTTPIVGGPPVAIRSSLLHKE